MTETIQAQAGGPRNVELEHKLRAVGETMLGAVLMTTGYWDPLLDHLMSGLHWVAAITGAAVGIHGVWRIFRSSRAPQ